MKNIQKVVEVETVETPVTEEVVVNVGKPKWSLKKKLIVAGAAVAGLVLGAVALSLKKAPNASEEQLGIDGTEEQELITMEEQEAEAASLTQTEF